MTATHQFVPTTAIALTAGVPLITAVIAITAIALAAAVSIAAATVALAPIAPDIALPQLRQLQTTVAAAQQQFASFDRIYSGPPERTIAHLEQHRA